MKKIVNIPCYSYEFVEGWLDITSTINQSIVFMGHKIFSGLATHSLYYFLTSSNTFQHCKYCTWTGVAAVRQKVATPL